MRGGEQLTVHVSPSLHKASDAERMTRQVSRRRDGWGRLAQRADNRMMQQRFPSSLFELVLISFTVAAALTGCATDIGGPIATPDGATEGEGEAAEGEGEDGGEGGGEGEGEANIPNEGEGEGEGTLPIGEGEGEGEGASPGDACATALCGSAPASSLVFTIAENTRPALRVDGGNPITIGTTTRNSVQNALGAGVNADELGFRVRYCGAGVEVQYVDSDGTFDGASPQNTVARIVTLPGANATAGAYVVGGAAPLLGSEQIFAVEGGAVRFDSARGIEAIVGSGGDVSGLVAFRPQDSVADWGVAFNVSPSESSLGGVRAGGQDLGSGDTFADLEAIIGDAFDADGSLEVDVSGFTVDVHVRVYAALGIRVAGACGFDGCDDDDEIASITLSPPYAGSFGGLALSDDRDDVEAIIGEGNGPDANGMVAYSGFSSDFGVSYVEGGPCAGRAAMFVLGYDPP